MIINFVKNVKNALREVKSNATGIDNIQTKCRMVTAIQFAHIVNVLLTSAYPTDWKYS